MRTETRLPASYPAGTKYVLESKGPFVLRFIEFPDGRRLKLDPRKAQTCRCLAERGLVDAATPQRRVAA